MFEESRDKDLPAAIAALPLACQARQHDADQEKSYVRLARPSTNSCARLVGSDRIP